MPYKWELLVREGAAAASWRGKSSPGQVGGERMLAWMLASPAEQTARDETARAAWESHAAEALRALCSAGPSTEYRVRPLVADAPGAPRAVWRWLPQESPLRRLVYLASWPLQASLFPFTRLAWRTSRLDIAPRPPGGGVDDGGHGGEYVTTRLYIHLPWP